MCRVLLVRAKSVRCDAAAVREMPGDPMSVDVITGPSVGDVGAGAGPADDLPPTKGKLGPIGEVNDVVDDRRAVRHHETIPLPRNVKHKAFAPQLYSSNCERKHRRERARCWGRLETRQNRDSSDRGRSSRRRCGRSLRSRIRHWRRGFGGCRSRSLGWSCRFCDSCTTRIGTPSRDQNQC